MKQNLEKKTENVEFGKNKTDFIECYMKGGQPVFVCLLISRKLLEKVETFLKLSLNIILQLITIWH